MVQVLVLFFFLPMTLAALLLLATAGVVCLSPRLIALLPYLFYYSLFAMIATMLQIGLWTWSTLSTGGSQGGGYSPKCLEEAFSELQIQSAA